MSESYADTIKPKSDQLNADDLLVGPMTVTVTDVKRGPVDQPVHISIEGQQPYKPCKSLRLVIISALCDKGADWIGKSMTLYCDPSVKFGGVELGGIRISHMSDIKAVMNIMLTASRGRKSMFTIKPLVVEAKKESVVELSDNDKLWVDAFKNNPKVLDDPDVTPEYKQFIIQQSKLA